MLHENTEVEVYMMKLKKKIILGLIIGALMSTTTVFAQTRDFIFI